MKTAQGFTLNELKWLHSLCKRLLFVHYLTGFFKEEAERVKVFQMKLGKIISEMSANQDTLFIKE